MDIKNLSPENADLAENLLNLGLSEEEIMKGLSLQGGVDNTGDGEDLKKSIDDQILAKEKELEDLKNSKQSLKKSDNNDINVGELEGKIDDISKSFECSLSDVNEKVDSSNDLIKSLTDVMQALKESNEELRKGNEQLKDDNDQLKKSLKENGDILSKIASMSPGLRSLGSNPGFTPRFQPEIDESGKQVLSKSLNKSEILSRLSGKLNNGEFLENHGADVSNYEISGKMSGSLEKAIVDELNIKLKD